MLTGNYAKQKSRNTIVYYTIHVNVCIIGSKDIITFMDMKWYIKQDKQSGDCFAI